MAEELSEVFAELLLIMVQEDIPLLLAVGEGANREARTAASTPTLVESP